jgi:hypothetical protein
MGRDIMISDIDEQLAGWVGNVLGPVAFSLAPPEQAPADIGVSCYLMELLDNPPLRTTRRPPLQITLRYLVTTWADTAQQAHEMLEELLFATMETPDLEVEVEPAEPTMWAALGVAPRPSFFLRVPLRRERPQPGVKLVRQPLGIEAVPIASLQGQVVGLQDVPLAGAVVEIPGLELSTRTDIDGHFQFATLPAGLHVRQLCVRAKGQEICYPLEDPVASDERLLLRFEPSEWKES